MRKQPIRAFLLLSFLAATASATGDWKLRPDGFGPARVGMTLAQVRQVLHEPLSAGDRDDLKGDCFYAESKAHPHLGFMIIDGKFVRADVDKPGISTPEGIQVGDSEAKVRKIYGKSVETEPHKYFDDGHYLTVNTSDGRYGTRFETERGKVINFYAGDADAIQYVEGCL